MYINISKGEERRIKYSLITIRNDVNFEVCLTDVGGKIRSISYPNKKGEMQAVTTCCKDMYEFLTTDANYGNTVGRVAGRIKNAEFDLNGKHYKLEANEGPNSLHSGSSNYGFRKFDYEIRQNEKKTDVIFTLFSPDGDGGFPGNVKVKVVFSIPNKKKEVTIKFNAKTDAPTLINLTNHVYLNLNGGISSIHDQELFLRSSKTYKMDGGLILGELEQVPEYLDYTKLKRLGIHVNHPELVNHRAGGIDHVFVLDGINKSIPSAMLVDKKMKRKMTMYTNYPAVVVYSDNYPSHKVNLSGVEDDLNYGITFETVIPTRDVENVTFTKDKPYSYFVTYKFK